MVKKEEEQPGKIGEQQTKTKYIVEHIDQCINSGTAVPELQQRGPLIKVVSSNNFKEDSFVPIRHNEWTDEPVIGPVLVAGGKGNSHIQVRWYDGTCCRKWKASKQRLYGDYVPWIDTIYGGQVLLYFTVPTIEQFRLLQDIVTLMKSLYLNS